MFLDSDDICFFLSKSFRYAKANHPGVQEYDPTLPPKHLIYLDANNLYGWAMSRYLPVGDFRLLTEEEINTFDLGAIADNSEDGYILEVDLGENRFIRYNFYKF